MDLATRFMRVWPSTACTTFGHLILLETYLFQTRHIQTYSFTNTTAQCTATKELLILLYKSLTLVECKMRRRRKQNAKTTNPKLSHALTPFKQIERLTDQTMTGVGTHVR